jgi:dihydropteroate synthase
MLREIHTINCRGRLLDLSQPKVMGILNLTPDSFSDGGRYNDPDRALRRAEEMLAEGADLLDLGAYSSRPGAEDIPESEELARLLPPLERLRAEFPEALISVDSFRPGVAAAALERGAHLINDIRAGLGSLEPGADRQSMLELLAATPGTPYILMHMQGVPQTMQEQPRYGDLVEEVRDFLIGRVQAAREAGIHDLILDPGFGFGKSLLHNYQLWAGLPRLASLGLPLLVGISRKSFLWRLAQARPEEVLDLASALHLQALRDGARLLRVHDVAAARRICHLFTFLKEHGII